MVTQLQKASKNSRTLCVTLLLDQANTHIVYIFIRLSDLRMRERGIIRHSEGDRFRR